MSTRQTFRFGSKASAHMAIIRGAEPIRVQSTGQVIGREKEIVAEFGVTSPEFDVTDVNGEPLIDPGTGRQVGKTANVRGHYFDSRAQQEQKGWTDEEHDRVVARLNYLCQTHPGLLWPIEPPKALIPWPTYDNMHHNTIPQMAADLGLLGEALTYEVQNKNRDSVVKKLEALLEAQQADAEAEAALTA